MATSHPTSKPNSDAMSLRGGWTQPRSFWIRLAATAAVALLLVPMAGATSSGREPEPALAAVEAAATVESPRTIASSWSMPPLPEDGSWAASGTSQSPVTESSSLVMAVSPR